MKIRGTFYIIKKICTKNCCINDLHKFDGRNKDVFCDIIEFGEHIAKLQLSKNSYLSIIKNENQILTRTYFLIEKGYFRLRNHYYKISIANNIQSKYIKIGFNRLLKNYPLSNSFSLRRLYENSYFKNIKNINLP